MSAPVLPAPDLPATEPVPAAAHDACSPRAAWRRALRVVALLATLTAAGAASAQDVAFTDVRLFDGESVVPSTTVVVRDGVVQEVGRNATVPTGMTVIDGAGRTLLPGLIDAHVHVFYPEALVQALAFGVTTVLDMFTDPAFASQMRAEQAAGPVPGRADMYSAGYLATAPGGHGTQFGLPVPTLTAPDQAAAWVDARIAEGSDYIKVVLESGEELGTPFPTLDDATLRAVIEAAHARDMLVVTHVQTFAAAEEALAAGTDGLAHMFVDAVADDAFVDAAVSAGLFVIPTFVVFQSIGNEGVDTSVSSDPDLAPYLASQDLQNLASPYAGFEGLSLANALESVRKLHDAGVPILAGTDAMNPGTVYGASLHRELVLLTDAGLTASEALASATSVTAEVFDLPERGVVRPGAKADLLLVEGDPTTDVRLSRKIVGVWKDGVRFDRSAYAETIAAQANAVGESVDALDGTGPVTISDFESGDLGASFGQPWVETTDALAGGDSTATVSLEGGGADGSGSALYVTGTVTDTFAFPWGGAMFQPASQPFAPADLSAKPVLRFAAKGQPAAYRIQVFCQNLGQGIGMWPFEVSDAWQTFEVDLGEVGGCDPSGVMAIVFSTGELGAYELWLDDVSLHGAE